MNQRPGFRFPALSALLTIAAALFLPTFAYADAVVPETYPGRGMLSRPFVPVVLIILIIVIVLLVKFLRGRKK